MRCCLLFAERFFSISRPIALLSILSCLVLPPLHAAANTNGAGYSAVVDQTAVTSHARMEAPGGPEASPSGLVVEVSTTDHSGISPVAASGMTALVGLFGPFLPAPVTSAMSFWLLY